MPTMKGCIMPTHDPVNHPVHYTQGQIELLDFILDQVVKYLSRYRHKSKPVEDLKKAQMYLTQLIQQLEARKP